MGDWEDEHFARMDTELMVWGRDRLDWRRASTSGSEGVEVAAVTVASVGDLGSVAVRHAATPLGSALLFPPEEWAAFTAGVRAGEFDFSPPGADGG